MSEIINIKYLIKSYEKSIISSKKLIFEINSDVYNITAPFLSLGKEYIAGRVEQRNSKDSKIMFFLKSINKYVVDKKAPIFNLEDPFIISINNEIIFGGVKVSSKNVYRTILFKGKDIYNLKRFKQGPKNMKDIRLFSLTDGRIGVFTRPQGKIGGRGRIGFMIINSLKEFSRLSEKDFYSAKLIPGKFDKNEWLGVNAVYILKNNTLGVIGHIACFSKDMKKHYYPISFNFDSSNNFSGMKIIAVRKELPLGESKSPELNNILFPGGLIRNKNRTAKLYAGAGDAEAYEILIKDPFLEYEKIKLY